MSLGAVNAGYNRLLIQRTRTGAVRSSINGRLPTTGSEAPTYVTNPAGTGFSIGRVSGRTHATGYPFGKSAILNVAWLHAELTK